MLDALLSQSIKQGFSGFTALAVVIVMDFKRTANTTKFN
jgi:hypothetical protein